jgi:hypothetical protein
LNDRSISDREKNDILWHIIGQIENKIFPLFKEEMEANLPEWNEMLQVEKGYYGVHTLGVLWCTIN